MGRLKPNEFALSNHSPDTTHLKQDSFGGCVTLWFMEAGSCLRGNDAGGGIGLVIDIEPWREGTRLLARKSGVTDSELLGDEFEVVGYVGGDEKLRAEGNPDDGELYD